MIKPILLLALALTSACSAPVEQVDQSTETSPDCDPGSADVSLLYTSADEPVVSDETAAWAQVSDCVEVPNHEPTDTGHSWCCRKADK